MGVFFLTILQQKNRWVATRRATVMISRMISPEVLVLFAGLLRRKDPAEGVRGDHRSHEDAQFRLAAVSGGVGVFQLIRPQGQHQEDGEEDDKPIRGKLVHA